MTRTLLACGLLTGCFDPADGTGSSGTDTSGGVGNTDAPGSVSAGPPSAGEAESGATVSAPTAEASTTGDAGSTSDPSSSGDSGSTGSPVDRTPPELESAEFVGYGEVVLAFDDDIDADALLATDFRVSPSRPVGITVESVELVESNIVAVHLDRGHLPVDYAVQWAVRNEADLLSEGTSDIAAADNGSRIAFVGSALGTGDLASWPLLAGQGPFATGLDAGDAICQTLADDEGYDGTFVAYLSDPTTRAPCRVAGFTGVLSANCGQAVAPDAGAWILPTGDALFSDLHALAHWDFRRSPAIDESGAQIEHRFWSSTVQHGLLPSSYCSEWTSEDGGGPSLIASPGSSWPSFVGTDCTSAAAMFCIQTEIGHPLNPRFETEGKLAFVTDASLPGGIAGGMDAADDLCQLEAEIVFGDDAGEFVAWISDTEDDAYCRLLGFSGRRANNCGQAALPVGGGPWVTSVGNPVADDISDLIASGPEHAIFQRLDGSTGPDHPNETSAHHVWTGTNADGSAAALNCGGWTSSETTAHGTFGSSAHNTDALWTTGDYDSDYWRQCNHERPFYCLER